MGYGLNNKELDPTMCSVLSYNNTKSMGNVGSLSYRLDQVFLILKKISRMHGTFWHCN